jgi:IstB-like ATP binding protein
LALRANALGARQLLFPPLPARAPGFQRRGDILGDAMIAAALIDRLVHHATRVTLKGKSYRLPQRFDPTATRAAR